MKCQLIARISLLILFLIVQVGCGNTTPTSTDTPPPPTEITPTEPAPMEIPAKRIDPVLKPSLIITGFEDTQSVTTAVIDHVIAFTTPGGEVLMKAAAVITPTAEDNLAVVGVVEIGPDAQNILSGVYTVALDLSDPEAEAVAGRLTPQAGGTARELTFARIPLERNPVRADDDSIPTIVPSILSDATCFTIGFADEEVAQNSLAAQSWSRFCSQASTDTDTEDKILSVRDIFTSQYEELSSRLKNSLTHVMEFLNANGYTLEDIRPDYDSIISEIESAPNIIDCNETQDCRSDLIGVPNPLFWEQYDKAKSDAAGNNFAVTIALARIERPMEIPDQPTLQPGDYLVRLWFDSEQTFIGATFFGVTDADELVPGQSVDAAASYLRSKANPPEIGSRISAWGLGTWCIRGQLRC